METYPHEHSGLGLSLLSLRQVNVHLVTVKVGIEGRAAALVEAKCPMRHHLGLNNITGTNSNRSCFFETLLHWQRSLLVRLSEFFNLVIHFN